MPAPAHPRGIEPNNATVVHTVDRDLLLDAWEAAKSAAARPKDQLAISTEARRWAEWAQFLEVLTRDRGDWRPTPGLHLALHGRGSERLHAPLSDSGPLEQVSMGQAIEALAHGSLAGVGGNANNGAAMKMRNALSEYFGGRDPSYDDIRAIVIARARYLAGQSSTSP